MTEIEKLRKVAEAARALIRRDDFWVPVKRGEAQWLPGEFDTLVDLLAAPVEPAPTYDMSIHRNTDAAAWAKFFCETWRKIHPDQPVPDEGWMLGWFANAMMAMHDAGPARAEGHRVGAEWMREQAALVCKAHLRDCSILTCAPPKSAAAWDAMNEIRSLPTSPPAPEEAKP